LRVRAGAGPDVLIHRGRLVDGTGGPVRTRVRVMIHDGLITTVEPDEGASPPSAPTPP